MSIIWALPQGSGFSLQSFLRQKEPQKRISTTIPNAKEVNNKTIAKKALQLVLSKQKPLHLEMVLNLL
ncbi:hypothetical protein BXU11_04235 [Flavobacterium sp. LM5]|uniref:hypothetical protein n=1 Tax=Flavobacterium sp. LM5 TaxID=1938610 RepID=UPI000993D021|nr:hypothetical protein [Flavobacterium sp. LM5]OOV29140.1 hypothetical protein BXU11_04235 [Flavobacterium sp. LM5]